MNLVLPTGRPGRGVAFGLVLLFCAVLWFVVAAPLLAWYDSRAEDLTNQRILQRQMHNLVAQLPALEQAARRDGRISTQPAAFLNGTTDAIAGADLE